MRNRPYSSTIKFVEMPCVKINNILTTKIVNRLYIVVSKILTLDKQ